MSASETPGCARCGGTKSLLVYNVMQSAVTGVKIADDRSRWVTRPVAVGAAAPSFIGHFETSTCRACGLTGWVAKAWQEVAAERKAAPCHDCGEDTLHARLKAVSICQPCGRVGWWADDDRHLEQVSASRHRRVEDAPPCFACAATSANIDDEVFERGTPIPVAVTASGPQGHYAQRVCSSCRSIEWYARGIDDLVADPDEGLYDVDDIVEIGESSWAPNTLPPRGHAS